MLLVLHRTDQICLVVLWFLDLSKSFKIVLLSLFILEGLRICFLFRVVKPRACRTFRVHFFYFRHLIIFNVISTDHRAPDLSTNVLEHYSAQRTHIQSKGTPKSKKKNTFESVSKISKHH
jgi:hypothetical protein